MSKAIKVISAVTVSDSVIFFYGMPSRLNNSGFDVAIASSSGKELDFIHESEGCDIFRVEMKREISLINDIVSLVNVFRVIRKVNPKVVNAGTPKAGLLYMLASYVLKVPVRIYHVRGLRHESLSGFSEQVQRTIEKLCGFLATHIVCETQSLKKMALKQNLYPREKCVVLGPGSSGVDLSKYNPKSFPDDSRMNFRASMGIPNDAFVIGFLGRVVPRKGISELLKSWSVIRNRYPNVYLLIAGPMEEAQPLTREDHRLIETDDRIVSVGKVDDAASYYSVMDVFTLPAHWEGFGNVLVEAASMGVPVITTNGTGTIDAVKNDYNGLVIPVKDADSLTIAIEKYILNKKLRIEHGGNGIVWARKFERTKIVEHLKDFYFHLFKF